MGYRITVDVGGTFTDVVVVGADGELLIGKAPTTPERAFTGVRDALENVAAGLGATVPDVLAGTDLFVYSTTRATNAVLERTTAKTALLTTEGFPDVLVLREGGKSNPFDLDVPYPEPYVPRRLTFEVPGRIDAEGGIVTPLDEAAVRRIARNLAERGVEAVAVCLLWSVANSAHELRVSEILADELPDVPCTLSHRLNPVVREYRRASATALDASLKPLMGAHLAAVAEDLAEVGFTGELVAATSYGGIMHIPDLAERPIFSVKSGPALAPVAGRPTPRPSCRPTTWSCATWAAPASTSASSATARSTSPARRGWGSGSSATWWRRRRWTCAASARAAARSRGWTTAGCCGSARSRRARPGPACYGRGGTRPTVTDAAVVLGYPSPAHFLGGRMTLDADAAWKVIEELGERLGLDAPKAADAVQAVASEVMVGAIGDITVNEGPRPAGERVRRGRRRGRAHHRADRRRAGLPPRADPAHGGRAVGGRRPVLRHRRRVHRKLPDDHRRVRPRQGQRGAGRAERPRGRVRGAARRARNRRRPA